MSSNLTVMILQFKELLKMVDDLNEEYKNKTIGVVYHRKLANIQNKIQAHQDKVIGVIRPGSITHWEITIELEKGIATKYITYPGHYDQSDISKLIEVNKLLSGESYKVLDIQKLGVIRLGELSYISGFK